MNATNRYLDRLMQLRGLRSDYAMSKFLGVSTASVSIWRSGSSQLGEDMAFRIARELDIDPIEIISAIGAERSKDARTQEGWREIFRRVTSHAQPIAVFGVAILATMAASRMEPLTLAEPENQAFLSAPALSERVGTVEYYVNSWMPQPAPIATGITPFDTLALSAALALAVFFRQRRPTRTRGAHAGT